MEQQKIIESFHMMWDNFPEPVLLIQKNRQIYAVNQKAAGFGLNTQMRCIDNGTLEQHKGCLCNRAADEKRTVCVTYDASNGSKAYGYWMPVAGAEEYILHFGVGAFSIPENDIKTANQNA